MPLSSQQYWAGLKKNLPQSVMIKVYNTDTCGLYHKNIKILNEASRVIYEGCHNLKHRLWSSTTLIELSITLLDNICSTGVTHNVFTVLATGVYVVYFNLHCNAVK